MRMVEIRLKTRDLKRLERLLPEYLAKRSKGMNAADMADKLGLPLKDIVSFLIERDILREEQVDLEFARIILAKNPELRESIVKRIDLSYAKLDHAIAVQDGRTLKEAVRKSEIKEICILLPQFAVILSVLQFPYAIAVMLFTTIVTLLLNGTLEKIIPLSTVQTTMNMLKNA